MFDRIFKLLRNAIGRQMLVIDFLNYWRDRDKTFCYECYNVICNKIAKNIICFNCIIPYVPTPGKVSIEFYQLKQTEKLSYHLSVFGKYINYKKETYSYRVFDGNFKFKTSEKCYR